MGGRFAPEQTLTESTIIGYAVADCSSWFDCFESKNVSASRALPSVSWGPAQNKWASALPAAAVAVPGGGCRQQGRQVSAGCGDMKLSLGLQTKSPVSRLWPAAAAAEPLTPTRRSTL